jgi:2-oxoglutarate ferredoxin oxidoreductase subunit delta
MSDQTKIEINESWCKGCKICVEVCPKQVLKMEDFVARVDNIDNCIECMLCEVLCPDFAIIVHQGKKKNKKEVAG